MYDVVWKASFLCEFVEQTTVVSCRRPVDAGNVAAQFVGAWPDEVRELRERLREAEARAVAAEVQAELAQTLPHVVQRSNSREPATVKKTKPR